MSFYREDIEERSLYTYIYICQIQDILLLFARNTTDIGFSSSERYESHDKDMILKIGWLISCSKSSLFRKEHVCIFFYSI